MTDADLIQHLRTALSFARPFVVGAADGRGRWAMAAGGAVRIVDSALIAADIHYGGSGKTPENQSAPHYEHGSET